MYQSIINSKNIIANLWANNHTIKNKDVCDNICDHTVISNQLCQSCGKFMGHWGEESDIFKFYDHTYQFLISNKDADNIYIISKHIFPFEIKKVKSTISLINYNRRLVVLNNGNRFINVFTKKEIKSNQKVLFKNDHMSYLFNRVDNDTVFLNPQKEDLGLPIQYIIYNDEVRQNGIQFR